jgi:hypothetical protein
LYKCLALSFKLIYHAISHITTTQVGAETLVPGADVALLTMHQLPAALPELLDQPGLVHDGHHHNHPHLQPQPQPLVPAAAVHLQQAILSHAVDAMVAESPPRGTTTVLA